MLKTKSILAKKEDSDGLRISVMSRHTLNDGITPHPEINCNSYDIWMHSLAPPTKLVGDYYLRNLPWKLFEERYFEQIRQTNAQSDFQNLAKLCIDSTVTLLCIENSPEHCHRRLLAEECKRYQPDLNLDIK